MNRQAALLGLMIAGGFALAAQGPSAFEVASIKPSQPNEKFACDSLPGGRFVCHQVYLRFLLNLAFGSRPVSMKGAPAWLDEPYDIDAKAEGAGEMTNEELAAPLLALFRDRFGLVAHEETIQQTVYFLERQKSGLKLRPSAPETGYSATRSDEGVLIKGETMGHFAGTLEHWSDVNATVIDDTGLAGKFDFTFPYINVGGNGNAPAAGSVAPDAAKRFAAAYSSTFDALNTVGLRLRPEKRDATALVIDQIHKPTGN
jgi:uncharacterized protein (TIGR03435 family)